MDGEIRLSHHPRVRVVGKPFLRRPAVLFAHADADGRHVVEEEVGPVIRTDDDDHIGTGGTDSFSQFRKRVGKAALSPVFDGLPVANQRRRVACGEDARDLSHVAPREQSAFLAAGAGR